MEAVILIWIQENLRAPWFDPIVKGITYLGEAGWFWILLSLVLILTKTYRKTGIECGTSLVLHLILVNGVAKNLFRRVRPYEVIDGLINLVGKQSDFSFPSGHTAASFAVAVVLLLRAPKKISIPAIVLAVLISLSRLYVGVHYPTDVLGGAIIGTLCAFLAVWLVDAVEKKIKARNAK